MSLFDEASIVSSRLGMTIREVYVWMHKHDHTLKQVVLFRPIDVIACIEQDRKLEEIGTVGLENELKSIPVLSHDR